MEFNTDNLQVGDKVIVVYRDNFSGCRKYVGSGNTTGSAQSEADYVGRL